MDQISRIKKASDLKEEGKKLLTTLLKDNPVPGAGAGGDGLCASECRL